MGSSLLDELPCLLDEADELVARLSFYLKLLFSPPPTRRAHPSDPDKDPYVLRQKLAGVHIDAIARRFSKHLLMVPTATSTLTEKLDALLPPSDSESFRALQTLAAKIFHLMKRVYQWQQTTWDETLMPFFVADSNQLTFDRHRLLTSLVLTGITKSVKLHLLWSSCPNLAGVLVLHSFLDSKQRPNDPSVEPREEEAYRPLDFVLYFGSNPLIKIQQELQQHVLAHNVARNMLELVLSCFDCYVGCHDLAHLKNGGQFFEIDAAAVQGTYASSAIFQDVLVLPQMVEWVLCVALCLPHKWKSEPIRNSSWQLWDFVQLIAQDRLVLVVTRDLVVNVHDLLFQQLVSALSSVGSSAAAASAVALQPLKKTLTRFSKRAVQCAGELRRERRMFVLWFLRDSIKLMQHNCAIAAPQLPRLLAVMALAQDELEWVLAHSMSSKLLPMHIKLKHLERSTESYEIGAAELTDLLGSYYELGTLLAREGDCVRRYYMHFIAHGDADAIAREIQNFLSESEVSRDDHVVAMLQSFTDRRRFQLASSDAGFASWRRQWQQLSVHLLIQSQQPNPSATVPAVVTSLLNRVCRHANYIQAYEVMLQGVSSLSSCFWFQDALDRCSRALMKGDGSSANTVIVLVVLNALATGRTAVSALLEPSEVAHEVSSLRRRVEHQKIDLSELLRRTIAQLMAEEEKLHARLSPLQMFERIGSTKRIFQNGVSSSTKTAETAATAMLLLTPGTESRLLSVPDAAVMAVQPLVEARCHLAAIVASLNVYAVRGNDALGLRELVTTNIRACVVRFLRGLFHDRNSSHGDKKLILRGSWQDAARQWRAMQRCLNQHFKSANWIHVPQLIASALEDECLVETDKATLMDRVLGFYKTMLETKCDPHKSHATLIACLATSSYVVHRSRQPSEMDPSAYASAAAFGFLEEIVGHAALARLRNNVVSYVASHTKALYATLETDKIALIRLKLAFPNDQSEMHMAVRIMEALDSGIVHELLCVGNGVFLLQVLDAADFTSINTTATLRFYLRELWMSGDPTSESELPTHVQTIWNLLPWAFVALFYGSVWTKTKYLREIDATTTNVHLTALAMRLLVETFDPRGPVGGGAGARAGAGGVGGGGGGEDKVDAAASARMVAHVVSQAVLSLRRVASDLPSLAMVAVAREVTRGLMLSRPQVVDGEMDDWLPDFFQKMLALAA